MTTSPVMTITDELLAELGNTLTAHIELNTSNYGHDDVCQLNSWAIGACDAMERADLHIRNLTERLEKAEKNAARFRYIEDDADSGMSRIYVDNWAELIGAAIAQEGAEHE